VRSLATALLAAAGAAAILSGAPRAVSGAGLDDAYLIGRWNAKKTGCADAVLIFKADHTARFAGNAYTWYRVANVVVFRQPAGPGQGGPAQAQPPAAALVIGQPQPNSFAAVALLPHSGAALRALMKRCPR
jgi:hypothetical protein